MFIGNLNSIGNLPISGGAGASYLVDTYSAPVAFSVRKISSTATNCLRVRRSSDNAEQDIGFSGNDLDTASISSFVGANDGRIVKWYNQGTGGATYDASQVTATEQMYIVASGTLYTAPTNGIVALRNTSGGELMSYTSSQTDFKLGTIIVTSEYATAGGYLWGHRDSANDLIQFGSGATNDLLQIRSSGTGIQTVNVTNNNPAINWVVINNSTPLHRFSSNGDAETTNATSFSGTINASTTYVGGTNNSFHSQAYFQEVIVFHTDETSNKADLLADINTYYSIY